MRARIIQFRFKNFLRSDVLKALRTNELTKINNVHLMSHHKLHDAPTNVNTPIVY